MTKYKLTYDETRIIVMSLIELKNQLIREESRNGVLASCQRCQQAPKVSAFPTLRYIVPIAAHGESCWDM